MQKAIESRLQQLRAEFNMGQEKLRQLEAEAAEVRSTLLRISGAIQVLEELLAKTNEHNGVPRQQEKATTGEEAAVQS